MSKKLLLLLSFFCFCFSSYTVFAQDIEIFQQFNGRYDYTAIGNTLNLVENGNNVPCLILTQSSATLNLDAGQNVSAAYLYWAGSGEGDFEVELNGVPIVAERTFSDALDEDRVFFAAFANVTSQLLATGNGNYTLSELDLTEVIAPYCPTGTNFGGWAIIIIYEDASLPLNQLNIYDGLESVSSFNTSLSFTLENLNVIDNQGAKIGFLAWEGDSAIAVNETLQINGNSISNPPLNPADNAFNSTNSFTNSSELWNMDIDFYNIENNIQIGDISATISLTSGQDFVMINNIVTVLNSQLPDATIEIDSIIAGEECGNRDVFLEYTVYNLNSTGVLPPNTAIGFYANNTLLDTAQTINEIPIDGSESGEITLTIPGGIPEEFILRLVVDYNNQVAEIIEDNNEDSAEVTLLIFPEIIGLINLEICDALGVETFDLTESTQQIDPDNDVTFHLSEMDAEDNINPIPDPENFENTENPQTIFVRVANTSCYIVESFTVEVIICPLPDATIAITNELNACRQRNLFIAYSVYNLLGTAPLPAQTPIALYVDGILTATTATQSVIPIGGEIQQSMEIAISDATPDVFELLLVVDDTGDSTGIVEELDETNNNFTITVTFQSIPEIPSLSNLKLCNKGFGLAYFDLTLQDENISGNQDDEINYFTTFEDALENTNPIESPFQYQSISNPQTIYVRLENEICFTITHFSILTEDCDPFIPQGFSPNNDTINDFFEITGLLNVFPNHELFIYSRNGNIIFEGNNETGFWNGDANAGILYDGPVPAGLYYYVLNLNHPDFKIFTGWVYLNK